MRPGDRDRQPLKDKGFLTSNAGAFRNVVKIRPPLVFAQQRRRRIPHRLRRDDRRARWIRRPSAGHFTAGSPRRLSAFPIEPDALELVSLSENVTFKVIAATARPTRCACIGPGYHTLDELVSERDWIRALDEAGIAVPSAGPHPRRPRLCPGDDPGHRRAALRRPGALDEGRLLAEVLRRDGRRPASPRTTSSSSAPSRPRCTTRPRPGNRRRDSRATPSMPTG